jgi:hypothetical protein
LFGLFETYQGGKDAAAKVYHDIMASNVHNGALKPINDIGDEAFIQGDGIHVVLLMAPQEQSDDPAKD